MRMVEKADAVMEVRFNSLAKATEDNTAAVRKLTDALTLNKGVVIASARFAGFVTLCITALWSLLTFFGIIKGH